MKKKKTFSTSLCVILLSVLVFSCDGGSSTPPEVGTGEGLDGKWDWSTVDDSKPNTDGEISIPKPPYTGGTGTGDDAKAVNGGVWKETWPVSQGNWGGTSEISGVVDTEDPATMKPIEKKVIGAGGAEVTAFSFSGVVQVSKDQRSANEGARFPMVGWEAVPIDDETLVNLRNAWAYSFYVRVNSASVKRNPTANAAIKWVFKTAVCADGFAKDQGHEFKHYFGNASTPTAAQNFGPNATTNFTGNLALAEWHKIIVVLDPENESFNLDQDNHIHQYNQQFEAAFDPKTATKIQWQIALQDQEGISDRGGAPYDINRGVFEYDVEFYGLELHLPE